MPWGWAAATIAANNVDQNFDVYSVEYTFPDGGKLLMDGRCDAGLREVYHSCAQGSKGYAVLSKSGDCGGPVEHLQGPAPPAIQHDLGVARSHVPTRIRIRTNGKT